jgi:hypothetical protein
MRHSFNHVHMVTLDELPALAAHNVAPNVRIEGPADGAALPGPNIELHGVATDRNGNLESVALHALSGPWRNWFLRDDEAVATLFPASTRVGEAELKPDGRWSFAWKKAPAGFHNLIAFARDAEGAVACSNDVRITVGIENLARGKTVTASSTSEHGGGLAAATDGDPFTMWWSDKAQPDPQRLEIDLGSERAIGAVAALWWKPYARDYTVQVWDDLEEWMDVGTVKGKRNFFGDMDVVRFKPVRARRVRLHCTKRAVDWQAYTVYELGVFQSLPQPREPEETKR